MKPIVLLALTATALCVSLARATDLASISGHEKKPHADTVILTTPLPKPAQQQVLAKMHRVRDLLLATPALSNLRGYDWETFDSLKNDHRADFPVVGRVGYIPFPYAEIRGKVASSAEGPPFFVHFNDPEIVLGQNGYNVDRDAGFTVAPRIVAELDGWPVYDEQFVAITKDRRPLFVPVSEAQYLGVVIANARRELIEMKKRFAETPEDPAASTPRQQFLKPFELRLVALEAELAGLPESERAAPARFKDGKAERASGLASTGEPSTRPISMLNPKVFDPSKPKGSIQLIVLGTTRYLPGVFNEVQKQLDKQALVALLD